MKTETSRGFYFLIWGALLFLLLLTWGAAQFHFGPFNVIVALLVALVKMALVILYFMHVRQSRKLTWIFVAAGFFWLGILIVLGMSDYLSRGWTGE
jgi:cytochrome c oxidase subunit 4